MVSVLLFSEIVFSKVSIDTLITKPTTHFYPNYICLFVAFASANYSIFLKISLSFSVMQIPPDSLPIPSLRHSLDHISIGISAGT